jgi:hypothetical protein
LSVTVRSVRPRLAWWVMGLGLLEPK